MDVPRDFVNIGNDAIFASFDVVSLYTNISLELGMEAISYWLQNSRSLISERFSNDFILGSVKFVLENNFFSFENDLYVQIRGTAMGTKMAPTYAILVMGFIEVNMYRILKEIHNEEISNSIKNTWLRYIDDCWIIWERRFGDITDFYNVINGLNDSIKFTMESNSLALTFLDVLVYRDENKVETDIFYKPTDGFSYVPYNSAHPRHTLNNVPYTLANRIVKIVSQENKKEIRLLELKDKLLKLNYPESLINNAFLRAQQSQTTNCNRLNESKSNVNSMIPFITTHNKNNPNIFQEVILPVSGSLSLIESFKDKKIMRVFKQPKSLLRSLCQNNRKTINGVSRCGEPRCACCETMIVGKTIVFDVNGVSKCFTINSNLNCYSSNVIYVIRCKNCQDYYIGHTGGSFRKRLTLHRQQMFRPQYTILDVSRHISMCAATTSLHNKFEAAPIYKMSPSSTRIDRDNKEKMLISMLQPKLNKS